MNPIIWSKNNPIICRPCNLAALCNCPCQSMPKYGTACVCLSIRTSDPRPSFARSPVHAPFRPYILTPALSTHKNNHSSIHLTDGQLTPTHPFARPHAVPSVFLGQIARRPVRSLAVQPSNPFVPQHVVREPARLPACMPVRCPPACQHAC